MAAAPDILDAVRARSAHETFGDRLLRQEAKIINNLVSKYGAGTLDPQHALVQIGVIAEMRKLNHALRRDVIDAIEELEND